MINDIIIWELNAIAISFFKGVYLAWIYDNIRVYRRIIRHKTIIFMSIEDIVYGIFAGINVFIMCFRVTDGIIRGFVVTGIAAGMFLYFKFLSRIYIKWSVRIINFLLKPVFFVLKKIFSIITIPVRSLKTVCTRRMGMHGKHSQE